MSARVRLRAGHVQPVWAGHPWVFAQAIDRVEGAPSAGDAVDVIDAQGHVLGRGYWSPGSAIPVRILSRTGGEPLEAAFLGRRLDEAAAWRRSLLGLPNERTTGYRLVHAEGDRLPGLVVDVYGDVASVQLLTIGMKRREQDVFAEVQRVTRAAAVVEIASDKTQKLEGFSARTGTVRGPDVASLRFAEHGFAHEVVLGSAQKTGFYFDQRENRARVEELAAGKRVLDAFSYTGAFALAAARGGASHVTALDSSAVALAEGAVAAEKNGLAEKIAFVRGDAKRALPEMAARGERFDLVIVDPPKLVPTAKHLEAGARAYRRLNAAAARLVAPGGLLVSCSCSAGMRASDFLRAIGLGARDAGREAALLEMRGQAADHPVPPAFPDGRYLKCAILRVA